MLTVVKAIPHAAWLATVLLVLLVLIVTIANSSASDDAEKERAAIPEAVSVSRAGVRYEAIVWGRTRGLQQNGSFVAAVDVRTGRERWIVKIYDAAPDDDREADKRDVFITALSLDAEGRFLHITNEQGAVFRLDTRTRKVMPLHP